MLLLRNFRKGCTALLNPGSASVRNRDGWLVRRFAEGNDLPKCLELLGISQADWESRCGEWGLGKSPDLSGLASNLDVLERWGMRTATRKKLVMNSVSLSRKQFDAIEGSLLWMRKQLDMGDSEIAGTLHKFPRMFDLRLSKEHEQFLKGFVDNGHSMEEVRQMVVEYPWVLASLDKFGSLSNYFQGFGYTRAQFMVGVLKYPKLVDASVDETLRPKLDFLESMGLSNAQVLSILVKYPYTFCKSISEDLTPRIQKFTDLGLTRANVNKILRGCPSLLFRSFEELVQDKIDWLESDLSFRRETALKVLVRHPRIFASSLDTWKDTCKFFSFSGMSQTELMHRMKRCPKLLGRKPEGLREKYEFAKTVLKKEPMDVLRQVRYFTYSFEDRILFRTALSKEHGKDITKPSFRDLMDPSDVDFCKRFKEGEVEAFRRNWENFTKEEKMHMVQFKLDL